MQISRTCVGCGAGDLSATPAILMPFVAHRAFGWTPVRIDASWGLRTVESGNAYALCNSLLCARCGLLFLDIRFSDDEMHRLYAGYRGDDYCSLRERYEPGYAARNRALSAARGHRREVEAFLLPHLGTPPGRVLDWGGDTGLNAPFLGEGGGVDVFDISENAPVDGARRVDRATVRSERYDLVVCSQVLEHLPDPHQALLEIRDALSQRSLLYVEVPLEKVMEFPPADPLRHKRHWHEHVNFFSRASLEALMTRSGLEVLELRVTRVRVEEDECSIFQLACRRDPQFDRRMAAAPSGRPA